MWKLRPSTSDPHQQQNPIISARSEFYVTYLPHTQVATRILHNIMFRIASVLALVVACRIPSVAAFSAMIRADKIARGPTTSLNYYPDETSRNLNYHQGGGFPETQHDITLAYDRALDCVNNFGMCDIDELLDLSEGKFASIAYSTHYAASWHCTKLEYPLTTYYFLIGTILPKSTQPQN